MPALKFGLSRAEYDEYIKLAGETRLIVGDRFDLTIDKVGADVVRITAPVPYSPVDGTAINFASAEVTTRFCKIERPEVVSVVSRNLGPWAGQSWSFVSADASTGSAVYAGFTIGKLESNSDLGSSGDWLIEYSDLKTTNGVADSPKSYILIVARRQP